MQRDTRPPTQLQLEIARELINQDKSDPEWYELEKMSRSQMARFIEKAKDHLREQEKIKRQIREALDEMEEQA